jgi:putative transcriptional regulator
VTIVRRSWAEIEASTGRIDRERLDAVTEEDIARWKAEDGIDDSTWGPPYMVVPGRYVRKIREGMGLSQEAFAERYHLSLRTLQEWEQLRRVPDGPARALLQIIEREPEVAARALNATKKVKHGGTK